MLNESVLNVEVSCFKNYETPHNPVSINLMKWLTSTHYKDKVKAIRLLDDKKERDAIKATLPAITPSGLFSYRNEQSLINHNGLIQIDIDLSNKNLLISNWEDLKTELIKIPNIAYLGKSVSGLGYWGLIPIERDPINHRKYFESLKTIFFDNWGIELDDKPKNVASLRGYSFDQDGYFNHKAKPFTMLPKIQEKPKVKTLIHTQKQGLEVWIISKMESANEGERHGERLKYARLAGGYVSGGIISSEIENRLIQSYLSQYATIDSPQTQTKEIKAIQDGFKDGMKTPIYLEEHNYQLIKNPSPCSLTQIKTYEDEQIELLERGISKTESQTIEIWNQIKVVRDKIRNCTIDETAIQANRELLKQSRLKNSASSQII